MTTETYEQRREAEKKEALEAHARLVSMATSNGWTVSREADEPSSYSWVEIENGEQRLFITVNAYRNKGKYEISGVFPKDADGNYIHFWNYNGSSEHKPTRINVSASKPDAQVWKDIKRRIIPEYIKELAYCKERLDHTKQALDNRASIGAQVAEAMGEKFKAPTSGREVAYSCYLDNPKCEYSRLRAKISYSGESISIELDTDPETALKIIKLIKGA